MLVRIGGLLRTSIATFGPGTARASLVSALGVIGVDSKDEPYKQ